MRYRFSVLIFLIFWGIMIARLYQLSIKSNYYYQELAKENIERMLYLKPVRGEISDVNNKLLAMNRIGFSISIMPHISKESGLLEKVANLLVNKFPDLNKSVLMKVYKKNSSFYNHKYIKVVDFVNYADMMEVFPSISIFKEIKIEAETKRYYPYGKYVAHIVGYTGRSNTKENEEDAVVEEVGKVGKSGLEKYYNSILEGDLGYEVSKVNAKNKEIELLERKNPVGNRNIKLSVDIGLQQMIYERFGDAAGVAIVMKTNGEIISAVSYPSYDPNLFVGGISKKEWKALQENVDHPFTNKFIHGVYPPGSTIKMGCALAFEKSSPNILSESEYCKGHIELGKNKHKFRCWNTRGHGKVKIRRAIRESCDVFFYNKSLKVGINKMAENLRLFGLGVKTGVDMPREYNGIIPDKVWKMKRYKQPWYMGETVIAAIGQGYDLVTPLQISRYTALMATSNLVTPSMASYVDNNRTKRHMKHIAFDTHFIKEIRKGMFDVCNSKRGTAHRTMGDLPILVAGKTGTSQVKSIPQNVKKRLREDELEYYHRSHAWITTYAPYNNPQYIVTVLVEHGGHGGSTAGPIAADIYKWLYKNNYFKEIEQEENIEIKSELAIADENTSVDSNETNTMLHGDFNRTVDSNQTLPDSNTSLTAEENLTRKFDFNISDIE